MPINLISTQCNSFVSNHSNYIPKFSLLGILFTCFYVLFCFLFLFLLFVFIFIFNLFFKESSCYPPPGPTSESSSLHLSSHCLQEDVLTSIPHPTPLHPARPPYSLRSQDSRSLGASTLTEAKPGSPLLYKCQGPRTS